MSGPQLFTLLKGYGYLSINLMCRIHLLPPVFFFIIKDKSCCCSTFAVYLILPILNLFAFLSSVMFFVVFQAEERKKEVINSPAGQLLLMISILRTSCQVPSNPLQQDNEDSVFWIRTSTCYSHISGKRQKHFHCWKGRSNRRARSVIQ